VLIEDNSGYIDILFESVELLLLRIRFLKGLLLGSLLRISRILVYHKRDTQMKRNTAFRIDSENDEWIKRHIEGTNKTASDVIREALTIYRHLRTGAPKS